MNVYRSSTTMQMDAKYKAVKQSRCMTRVITALRSATNKTVSSRCDPKPGSLTGDAVQFWVGRPSGNWEGRRFPHFAIRRNRRTIKVVRVLRRATAGPGASLACLPYRRRGRCPSPCELTGSRMFDLRLPVNGSSSRSQTSREYEVSATN